MSADPSPPDAGTLWERGYPLGAPHEALLRLVNDLERWGTLFLDVAGAKGPPAAEQILGGLVEWMGSGLIDGFLYLPIPAFEAVSDLAEELFEACQTYLTRLKAKPQALSAEERASHEAAIRAVLARARLTAES